MTGKQKKGMKMNPDAVKNIKCDTCRVVCGLHMYGEGWRCPLCIWTEREKLIEVIRSLLSATDYTSNNKSCVVVSRSSMDQMKKAVQYATRVDKERN